MPNFKKTEAGVLKVLEIDPYAATSKAGDPTYQKLCILYWIHVDGAIQKDSLGETYYFTPEDIAKMTSSESITRAYRKLVERRLIKMGVIAHNKRHELEEEYREYAMAPEKPKDKEYDGKW